MAHRRGGPKKGIHIQPVGGQPGGGAWNVSSGFRWPDTRRPRIVGSLDSVRLHGRWPEVAVGHHQRRVEGDRRRPQRRAAAPPARRTSSRRHDPTRHRPSTAATPVGLRPAQASPRRRKYICPGYGGPRRMCCGVTSVTPLSEDARCARLIATSPGRHRDRALGCRVGHIRGNFPLAPGLV